METGKSEKSEKLFVCNHCDFKCSTNCDWVRHTMRLKHAIAVNGDALATKTAKTARTHVCDCGKSYSDRTGLWKHKQKCVGTTSINSFANLVIEVVKSNTELQKQNQEFKELLIDQNAKLFDTITQAIKHNSITNNNNINQVNSHNKTFNLQLFLNEDCKDAMNISDFVDSIKFQLSDLEHMGRVGYVEGLSNIIIKNMNALDVTKRPLHCTDEKRETLYIKDGGVWTKEDEDNKNVRKLIKKVAFRNSKNIRLFKEKHPDCITSESKYSDTYSKIIIEAMGGGSKCNDYDSENKIIKKLVKMITIDKQRT